MRQPNFASPAFSYRFFLRMASVVMFSGLCAGCMNPYYGGYGGYGYNGYGSPYGQPAYAPNSMGTAPGTYVIPEGQGGTYVPGTTGTYNSDPPDDSFNGYYTDPEGGGVPKPIPRRDSDLRGSSQTKTDFNEGRIRPVSGEMPLAGMMTDDLNALPTEYGYDTDGYTSLLGIVRYDNSTGAWVMQYSDRGSDQYGGMLSLSLPDRIFRELRDGDNVEVRGSLDAQVTDSTGRPVYRVDSWAPID